jgi:hypothetical protein
MRWYNAGLHFSNQRAQAMRTVAGALVFLGGAIIYSAPHLGSEAIGIFTMLAGVLIMCKVFPFRTDETPKQ